MAKRKTRFSYNILNIKINSPEGSSIEKYQELFERLHSRKISYNSIGSNHLYVRQLFANEDEEIIQYGLISRYTEIEGDNWLNKETNEIAIFNLPENLKPNLKDYEFAFFPFAHRIAVVKSNGSPSPKTLKEFFQTALDYVADEKDQVYVHVETDKGVIERIIEAPTLKRLEVKISYTNDDIGEETKKFMDDMLKDGHVGEIEFVAKADSTKDLNQKDNPLIRGSIEMAESNGSVKATIKNSEGKREIIETKMHPKIERGVSKTDYLIDKAKEMLTKIRDLFRSADEELSQ
jgi:hypothetical protein